MSDLPNQYALLHASQPDYGSASKSLLKYVLPLIGSFPCGSVIDYGCGKGTLGRAIETETGIPTYCYDPYVEAFSRRPSHRFDLLVNTDVLEHIPEGDLDRVFADMKALSDRCMFVISTRYADQILGNGDNAHCTVKPGSWWAERILRHFPVAREIPAEHEYASSFVTWNLADEAVQKIARAKRGNRVKRELKRFARQTEARLKLLFGWFASEAEILAELEGKSVSLVGNARSLAGGNHGEAIDAADLVIRCNRAPIVRLGSHGIKTDWIATGMALDPGLLRQRQVKRVLWLSPFRKELTSSMLRDRGMYVEPLCVNERMTKKIGRKPSTGFKMIEILSRSKCRKVDLFGFDFFDSLSSSGHHTAETAVHDFASEKRMVLSLLNRDKRFLIIEAENTALPAS